MIELPLCSQRREEIAPGHYRCTSSFLAVSARGVKAELCQTCPYANLDAEPAPWPHATPAAEPVVPPQERLKTCVHRGRSLKDDAGKAIYRQVLV